jgi:hypothetical protein
MSASATYSVRDSVMSHLLPVETSKERQFIALTTAMDQVLSRGCGNTCVLTFLGLGQRAASPPWPALTLTDLWNRKTYIHTLPIRFEWTTSWFAVVFSTPQPIYPRSILILSSHFLLELQRFPFHDEISNEMFICRPCHRLFYMTSPLQHLRFEHPYSVLDDLHQFPSSSLGNRSIPNSAFMCFHKEFQVFSSV